MVGALFAPSPAAYTAGPILEIQTMYRTNFTSALAPLAALAALSACATTTSGSINPTIRAEGVVVDDFEAEVSGGGLTVEGDTDYSAIAGFFGMTEYVDGDEGERTKATHYEVGVASSEFGDLDAIEIIGGGRYYFSQTQQLSPFFGFHAVSTIFDDVGGFDVGTQLALRIGGGLEFAIGQTGLFADVGVDYTLPILEAESDSVGGQTIDTDVSGIAVRVGVGFGF